jgi:uncharacterized protein
MNPYGPAIAAKLNLRTVQVQAVLELLSEGSTVPFIARYRKDRTGDLDEVAILQIQDEAKRMAEFDDRKTAIVKSITEQGKMTEELMARLDKAETLSELEDIYLPYKPKRKTKAMAAREKGLEPLALLLLQQLPGTDPAAEAAAYLGEAVPTVEEALQGARDILAETFSEDADTRAAVRHLFEREALLTSKVMPDKETEAAKFRDYFDFSEQAAKVPSHRALAVLRGFMEGFLRISIAPDEDAALEVLERRHLKGSGESTAHVKKAIRDGYRRLLHPALETELRAALKQRADEEAIDVFAENLRQLLLSSPLGGKRLIAIDPGYRTGCKTVCLDEKGDLLDTTVIFIHEKGRLADAEHTIRLMVQRHAVQAFAIGDGTAGRETEQFVRGLGLSLPVFLVNEDGASVYSASEVAREEFPDQDITVRGAVSIGRRLMDPLAELVKIDPKSIGVGQYQHDVNPVRLKDRLDQTVVSCVNQVGVNLNTASRHLLAYVSGINSSIAENIVRHRKDIGRFQDRKQLLKVARLGEKTFEQCAGFLRITEGSHPLDASSVHPEAYPLVERMASDLGVPLASLIGSEELVKRIDPSTYVDERFGLLTIRDILKELRKPGLDPREEISAFEFAGIFSIDDVQSDMIVPGIVTNITRFGAFVDIGVKQDGLVHISEISHSYVKDPSDALKLNQKVMVKVLEVDRQRGRISLSIRQATDPPTRGTRPQDKARRPEKSQQEPDLSTMDLKDALGALKRKFSR